MSKCLTSMLNGATCSSSSPLEMKNETAVMLNNTFSVFILINFSKNNLHIKHINTLS